MNIFSDKPTPLVGREMRELLTKAQQYKILFKQELKDFKIKQGASVDELKLYIEEMDTIVSMGSLDDFIQSTVLHAITLMEDVSAHTDNFDISGTAEMLKANPQFVSLCKQCLARYGSILKAPPEAQLGLLVLSTMALNMHRNRKKKQISKYLDQPA